MIFFDSVYNDIAKNNPRATISLSNIEQLYNADFIISSESFPPVLVEKHIEKGIIAGIFFSPLGTVYINDVKEFLIERIKKIKDKGIDRVYVVSTLRARNTLNGNTSFENTTTHEVMDHPCAYTAYLEVIETIADNGATFSFVPDSFISDWLMERQTYIKMNCGKKKPQIKTSLAEDVVVDNDWRKTLSTFPMIDYEFATKMRDNMAKKGIGVELFTALEILCNEAENIDTKGKALAIHRQARKWIGLPDGWDITVEESKVK